MIGDLAHLGGSPTPESALRPGVIRGRVVSPVAADGSLNVAVVGVSSAWPYPIKRGNWFCPTYPEVGAYAAIFKDTGNDIWALIEDTRPREVIDLPGPSGDTSGATDGALITEAYGDLGGKPGVLRFQGDHYFDNVQRNLDHTVSQRLEGIGGASPGAAPGTTLTYTGVTGPYISARSSYSFGIKGIELLYNGLPSGALLIDLSHALASAQYPVPVDSSMFLFEDATIGGAGIRTALLVNLNNAIAGGFRSTDFMNGLWAVQGRAAIGSYSNSIFFEGGCGFRSFINPPILEPGQGWTFEGPTFEGLFDGTAGAILSTFGCRALEVEGGWCGDGGTAGTWFDVLLFGGKISLYVGSGHTGVNVRDNSIGADLTGGTYEAMNTGIAVGSNCVDIDTRPNAFLSVPNPVTYATLPVGSILQDPSNRLIASQLTGPDGLGTKVADTTGLTSAQIDALFTQTPPDGILLADAANKVLLVRVGGKWNKTSALTTIA